MEDAFASAANLKPESGIYAVDAVRIRHYLRRDERECVAEYKFVAVNKIAERHIVVYQRKSRVNHVVLQASPAVVGGTAVHIVAAAGSGVRNS